MAIKCIANKITSLNKMSKRLVDSQSVLSSYLIPCFSHQQVETSRDFIVVINFADRRWWYFSHDNTAWNMPKYRFLKSAFSVQRQNLRFCPYMEKYRSEKTSVLTYLTQCKTRVGNSDIIFSQSGSKMVKLV